MSDLLPSDQKISQSCVLLAKKVNEIVLKHTNKKPVPVQIEINKENMLIKHKLSIKHL